MPTVRLTYLLKLLCRDGIQGALQLVPQALARIGHRLGRVLAAACERKRMSLWHRPSQNGIGGCQSPSSQAAGWLTAVQHNTTDRSARCPTDAAPPVGACPLL